MTLARLPLAAVATAAVVLALAPAAAPAARNAVTVTVTADLRSDYRFAIDFTDTSDPDCLSVDRGQSRVVTDMTTVRSATYRVTRLARRRGYLWRKRLGGAQRDTRGIDMRITQTRTTSGATTDCYGVTPYPADGCRTRSWDLATTPGLPIRERRRMYLGLQEIFDGPGAVVEHDRWLSSGCGKDSTNAQVFITQTRDLVTGAVQQPYFVRLAHAKLFATTPRRFTARGTSTFSTGATNALGGRWTEVRSAEVTIRRR